MAVAAVFFDIGGVLELTPKTGWESRWEAKLGLSSGELNTKLDDLWQAGMLGTIDEEAVARGIGQRLGLDVSDVQALMVESWNEYLGSPNSELIDYFASLRERARIAIISNSFVGAREREHERYDFGSMCELIVYSHEVGIAKPDPRIFELACERLSVSPRECLFVDDVSENISAAAALDMRAIRFRDNEQTIREIEAALCR